MLKKRKIMIISVTILFIVALVTVVAVVTNRKLEQKLPYIAFMENSTREDCIFICANGDIYAAASEEAFVADLSETAKKIREDNYGDMLELVGTTDAGTVKLMYGLYLAVVLKDEYFVTSVYKDVPAFKEYGGKVRYWTGVYYDEKGEMMPRGIYQSNADKVCSDMRAYIIVGWLYDCLKDYIE